MSTIDIVGPLKALQSGRSDEYRDAVRRIGEAGAAPSDAGELRDVAQLLADLDYPPERLQADLDRYAERKRAIADLSKANEMDRQAKEKSQEAKQLESESYAQPESQARETHERATICNERAAILMREASETRRYAQREVQSTGGDEFKPLTDEQWSARRSPAEINAEIAALTQRSQPEPWAYSGFGPQGGRY
ncbi:hypothetical protein [Botrimarina mediterranea]|uniref:hypothetical protein n=1 Tax=Botrimarina mediterranea TaxID=2528022 RepID=UPI00118C34A2|nr:hypothetical protein K2D_34820 [Planctomycetes bacterium K2D]